MLRSACSPDQTARPSTVPARDVLVARTYSERRREMNLPMYVSEAPYLLAVSM